MTFYAYILKSEKDNSYYIGSTNSLENRLKMHNGGRVKSTRYRRPLNLIYKEEYKSLKEAMRRELQIKSWKSRDSIENLIIRNLNNGAIV